MRKQQKVALFDVSVPRLLKWQLVAALLDGMDLQILSLVADETRIGFQVCSKQNRVPHGVQPEVMLNMRLYNH